MSHCGQYDDSSSEINKNIRETWKPIGGIVSQIVLFDVLARAYSAGRDEMAAVRAKRGDRQSFGYARIIFPEDQAAVLRSAGVPLDDDGGMFGAGTMLTEMEASAKVFCDVMRTAGFTPHINSWLD